MDQIFSQQGAFIARHTFDSPQDVVRLIDSTYRPEDPGERERKRLKQEKVDMSAVKLDSVALWQDWVAVLGVHFKGLRILVCLRLPMFPQVLRSLSPRC